MLNILLSAGVSICGLEPYRSTVLISSLFYVLTLFPLRRFLGMFLTPLQAAWGCLFYITAPKLIRFSVSGLIDSGRNFFLIAALLLLFQLREKPKIGSAVLFGLSLAGLSVSRGEELIFAIGILAGLPVLTLLKSTGLSRQEFGKRAAAAGIAALVFLAVVSPFCAVNAYYTGYFITDVRFVEALCGKPSQALQDQPQAAVRETTVPKNEDHLASAISNMIRGGYELYWVFSAIGMILLCWKRRWQWEHTVLIGIFLVHTVIYCKISSAYRYSIYLIPMFMPFTMTGLSFLSSMPEKLKWPERLRLPAVGAVCVLLVLLFGFQIENGMKCVTERKDVWFRQIADVISQWGRQHVPGRRVRLAAVGLGEIVYWSGADAVFRYKYGIRDLKSFRDFDLLLIPESSAGDIAGRRDLRPIPLPEPPKRNRVHSDRVLLFCRQEFSEGK